MYFGYTHTLKGWIFARVCNALQIKIVRVIPSPLPWSYYVVEGIGNVKTNIILPAAKCAIKDRLTKYVEILNSDYTLAKPYYERHRKIVFSNFTSAFVSFISQPIASTVALVKQSFKSIEKRRIYAEYKKFERCNDLPESYGVYFLHYQPESNTCPEAELFVDQFIAIKKVSEALPDGYRLLVREHPSTFSKRADGRWRPKCFYRRISELPLVDICDLDKSPFELMDSAAFVVSIAGIVLTEAIARRTPIVHFSLLASQLFRGLISLTGQQQMPRHLKHSCQVLPAKTLSFPIGKRLNVCGSFMSLHSMVQPTKVLFTRIEAML